MRVLFAIAGLIAFIAFCGGVVMLVGYFASGTRSNKRVGPAAAGTIYELLNEDKRKAVAIIVEQQAEVVDPEHKDGTL